MDKIDIKKKIINDLSIKYSLTDKEKALIETALTFYENCDEDIKKLKDNNDKMHLEIQNAYIILDYYGIHESNCQSLNHGIQLLVNNFKKIIKKKNFSLRRVILDKEQL